MPGTRDGPGRRNRRLRGRTIDQARRVGRHRRSRLSHDRLSGRTGATPFPACRLVVLLAKVLLPPVGSRLSGAAMGPLPLHNSEVTGLGGGASSCRTGRRRLDHRPRGLVRDGPPLASRGEQRRPGGWAGPVGLAVGRVMRRAGRATGAPAVRPVSAPPDSLEIS